MRKQALQLRADGVHARRADVVAVEDEEVRQQRDRQALVAVAEGVPIDDGAEEVGRLAQVVVVLWPLHEREDCLELLQPARFAVVIRRGLARRHLLSDKGKEDLAACRKCRVGGHFLLSSRSTLPTSPVSVFSHSVGIVPRSLTFSRSRSRMPESMSTRPSVGLKTNALS